MRQAVLNPMDRREGARASMKRPMNRPMNMHGMHECHRTGRYRCGCDDRRRMLRGLLAGSVSIAAMPLAGASISGCTGKGVRAATGGPVDFTSQTACSLDGMLLADYPGPKGQLLHAGDSMATYFCDTVELLSVLLQPEAIRAVAGAWVQDMGKADWEQPVGHWIDARAAWYVKGSRRRGSMGATFASFMDEGTARGFAAEQGGEIMTFDAIRPDMVDLRGGARSDGQM